MTDGPKKITESEWLQAYALYHLAWKREREATQFEKELTRMLGVEEGSHLADGIYGMDDDGTPESFTDRLERAGIVKAVR